MPTETDPMTARPDADKPVDNEAVRIVRDTELRQRRVFGDWISEARPRGEQVVLLMDFENLALGAMASLPDRTDPMPADAVTWLCRAYGPTTIRRAYADWGDTRFGRYQQVLERNGIDLVQIGHGPARKNGADIRMAVDAMETLIIHPAVEAFVLVTGDSDFSPLVSKLREFGKHVIGVGAETAASARLVSVCSEYKLWGSIVANVDPTADVAHSTASPGHHLADVEALVVAAIRQIAVATPTASQLKAKIVALDPSFDEANYGCGSFRDLLARLDHRLRIAGRSGYDITVALIDPAVAPPSAPGSAPVSGSAG